MGQVACGMHALWGPPNLLLGASEGFHEGSKKLASKSACYSMFPTLWGVGKKKGDIKSDADFALVPSFGDLLLKASSEEPGALTRKPGFLATVL